MNGRLQTHPDTQGNGKDEGVRDRAEECPDVSHEDSEASGKKPVPEGSWRRHVKMQLQEPWLEAGSGRPVRGLCRL